MMKMLRSFMVLALGCLGLSAAFALPPTQIGDSFLFLNTSTKVSSAQQVFYFAADGTCKLLLFTQSSTGAPTSSPSQAGTYTYVQPSGNPGAATLTITLTAGFATSVNLSYTSDTSGAAATGNGLGTFSLYLATPNTFLTNVSNRSTLRSTDSAISGFVIQGTTGRLVLVRAVGPGLAQFAVTPVAGNPQLSLFAGSSVVSSGQIWTSVTGYDAQAMGWIFDIAGAFPLLPASNDVVSFGVLAPGAYTAVVSDPTTGTTGGALLTEVYILPYSG